MIIEIHHTCSSWQVLTGFTEITSTLTPSVSLSRIWASGDQTKISISSGSCHKPKTALAECFWIYVDLQRWDYGCISKVVEFPSLTCPQLLVIHHEIVGQHLSSPFIKEGPVFPLLNETRCKALKLIPLSLRGSAQLWSRLLLWYVLLIWLSSNLPKKEEKTFWLQPLPEQ